MSETLTLPVLPLDDEVVLPGMVVPLETSQPEVSAAIDAARLPSRQVPGMRSEVKARVLLVPRLPDRGLAGVGTLAVVEQVGRLPGGRARRGAPRHRPGSRSARAPPGPARRCGSRAPWSRRPARGPRADELAQRVQVAWSPRSCSSAARGRSSTRSSSSTTPSAIADRAGYASYLTAEQKLQLLETADLVRAAGAASSAGPGSTWPSSTSPSPSARTSARAWRSSRRSSCCASSSPPSARSSPT